MNMLIAAGLAALSAGCALLLVEGKAGKEDKVGTG